jgi:hypothetical protein
LNHPKNAKARDYFARLAIYIEQGYSRDVIDVVVEDDAGDDGEASGGNSANGRVTRKALLYRGTPENPAFWERLVFDLPLAAGARKEAMLKLLLVSP